MSNDGLPWYKHFVNDWMAGSIQQLDFKYKGFFVDFCDLLWKNKATLSLPQARLAKIMRVAEAELKDYLDVLIDSDIIKRDFNGDLSVDFISEQYLVHSQRHEANVLNGQKGGKKSGQARVKPRSRVPTRGAQASSDTDTDTDSDSE